MSSPLALPSNPEEVEAQLQYDFNSLIGVTAALFTLSTIAVGLRCYVRGRVTRTFGLDDGLMCAAQVCFCFPSIAPPKTLLTPKQFIFFVTTLLVFVATWAEKYVVATGTLPMMSVSALVQLIRYSNAGYTLTMIIAKFSIGVFFLKLFTSTSFKWQRYAIMTLMGISTLCGTAYLIMTFATCGIMVQSQKTTAMHTGSDWCPSQDAFVDVSITYSAVNIFTDFAFTIMAVLVLCQAQMDRATKISASVLLTLGSIGCVASIMRILVQTPLGDIRLAGVLLGIWSMTEAGLCITAASLITIRPLVQPVIDKARSSFSSISSFSKGSQASGSAGSGDQSLIKSAAGNELEDLEKQNRSAVYVTKTFEIHGRQSEDRWSEKS